MKSRSKYKSLVKCCCGRFIGYTTQTENLIPKDGWNGMRIYETKRCEHTKIKHDKKNLSIAGRDS